MTRRNRLFTALFVAAGFAAAGTVAAGFGNARTAPAVVAQATDARVHSRAEGDEAMDAAVAAALVGALSTRLGERDVQLALDSVDVVPASLRDREVSGLARVRLGGAQEWIPLRFSTLYDTAQGAASEPRITLGGQEESGADADPALVATLARRAGNALAEEFSGQRVDLNVDHATSTPIGKRYLQVTAQGLADFGQEGTTPAQVQGLYDLQAKRWRDVGYELGTTANWAGVDAVAVAAR